MIGHDKVVERNSDMADLPEAPTASIRMILALSKSAGEYSLTWDKKGLIYLFGSIFSRPSKRLGAQRMPKIA